MQDIKVITRFGEPSNMDTAEFGTICKVANQPDTVDIYLQISHDENAPNWIAMGSYSSTSSDAHIYHAVHKVLQQ